MTRPILHGAVLILALCGVLAYAGVLPFAQAGTAPSVSLRAPSGAIAVGDTFEVEVYGQGMPPIGAFEAVVAFDETRLQYVGGIEAAFLGSTGRTVLCPPPAVTLPGIARFGCGSFYIPPPAPSGPSGDAVLARLTFRALAPGSTQLHYVDGGLATEFGDSIFASLSGVSIEIEAQAPPTAVTSPTPTATLVPSTTPTHTALPTETAATVNTNTAVPTPTIVEQTNTPGPPTETSTASPTITPTSTVEIAGETPLPLPTDTPAPTDTPTSTPPAAPSQVATTRTHAATLTVVVTTTVSPIDTPEPTTVPASETPAPRDTETPEPATETPAPKATDTPRPEPTPGTPVFAPPGDTPTVPAKTSTAVPTATNTRAASTPTRTRTPSGVATAQPGSPSPAATSPLGITPSSNDVLGQRVAPTGIVLPSTGHGVASDGSGAGVALTLAPIAAAFLIVVSLTRRRRPS